MSASPAEDIQVNIPPPSPESILIWAHIRAMDEFLAELVRETREGPADARRMRRIFKRNISTRMLENLEREDAVGPKVLRIRHASFDKSLAVARSGAIAWLRAVRGLLVAMGV